MYVFLLAKENPNHVGQVLLVEKAGRITYPEIIDKLLIERDSYQVKLIKASFGQRMAGLAVFAGLAGAFAILYFAGTGSLDLGRWIYPCGFKQSFGLPCPTCGMTTSAVTFASGDILKAFYIQPAGGLFCVLAVITGFLALIVAVFGVYFELLVRIATEIRIGYLLVGLAIILAGGWMVTLSRALAGQN